MNHLIFDIETTGFYNPRLSLTHPEQGRVIQLAAIKLDSELNEIESFSTLIKPPPNIIMNEGAFKQHGISLEKAHIEGIDLKEALAKFARVTGDNVNLIAHNIKFDFNMLWVEVSSAYVYPAWDNLMQYCTMELMTPIMKLPHKRRNSFGTQYKWPKLEEAYAHIKGQHPETNIIVEGGWHNALTDCKATVKIYKYLIYQGHIKFPAPTSLPVTSAS